MVRPRLAHLAALALGTAPAAQLDWRLRYPGEPLPRYRAAMVHDPLRAETLLFGGAPGPTDETWVFDGTGWERRQPATSPSPQQSPVLAFDSGRGVVVLFGRRELGSGAPETLEWDGRDWTRRTPFVQPPARERAALAFDAARGRAVLFGGHNFFNPRADTWEWDGTSWTQRTPATSPPARSLHGMAYDAARGRVLLFGGFGTTSLLGDTWEWDGTTWTQRFPVHSPPPRQQNALVYDRRRQRVVLFGGFVPSSGGLGDTWEWDGTDWSQANPAHAPPATFDNMLAYDEARELTFLYGGTNAQFGLAGLWSWDGGDWSEHRFGPVPRQDAALAHDPLRDRTVLFGGFHDPVSLGDTWEWDGQRWTELTTLPSPSGRLDAAMAFDATRRTVLLFGGYDGNLLDDTWEWDGAGWSLLAPATRPPARRAAAMAFDHARGRLLLFGGFGGDFTPALADTWEWDGATWSPRAPATVPPARNEHVLTYDARRRRVVLFGGQSCLPFQGCTPLGDTWEWNGSDWSPRALPGPTPRAYAAATYDWQRARTLLLGGLGGGVLGELWEHGGASWVLRTTSGGPSPRYAPSLAFDPVPGRTVLFGGVADGFHVSAETWELTVPCDALGPGHASGSLPVACSATPRIGARFCLTFSDPVSSGLHRLLLAEGPSRAHLPVALGSLCAPGTLYVPAPFQVFAGTGDPASYCQRVPSDARLIGVPFVVQGAVRETSGCWRLTDGTVLTIQP